MTTAKTTVPRDSTGIPVPLEAAADALSRAAGEAARQHERVAKLNERGAHHSEMQEATALCALAHQHLKARAELYESSAGAGKGGREEGFWHAANTLWHAARDYARRHKDGDAMSIQLARHSSGKFGELALDYELEASALLNMRNALAAYRKVRPEA